MSDLKLWYDSPARQWTEALPVGNGRLGAMVFGGVEQERLQLNEDTLWAGGPYSPNNPEALEHLAEVRRLLFAQRYAEAEALANRHLMARPIKQLPYQPAADLWFEQKLPEGSEASDYRRELDLSEAVARVAFNAGGVRYSREVFATHAGNVIAVRLKADRPGALRFAMTLTSPQAGSLVPAGSGALRFMGRNRDAEGIKGQLAFAAEARVATNGTITSRFDLLEVSGASEAVILVDIGTSFRRFDDVSGDALAPVLGRLDGASPFSFGDLRGRHVADYRALFDRLSIDLGRSTGIGLPTNRRIVANVRTLDPGLAALYVQYGRYLMISSSRPGTQPANLQGIWNDRVDPPWGSKYTANINLQMNYWLPAPANLTECMEPLLRLVEEVAITGRETARVHYGAPGWVLHHNTDLWRATAPIDGAQWGMWPTGGAWLCVQLWDHVNFVGDEALIERLYPLIAGAAEFFAHALVELPGTNQLVTSPSVSPENIHPHGASIAYGPAMDSQILRDLFTAFIEASERLGRDTELHATYAALRARLPADRIGKEGQLQEWLDDWDMEVPEIHHRHVSHLYALYPSHQISPDTTPELTAAARKSLEVRGDDATGWGLGWRINLWARLRDGDRAHAVVQRLLAPQRTYPNMFDAHPPFQIDGNFGGAAGVLEMLVQSTREEIHLLPALPSAWPSGEVRGIRVRGNVTVDLKWQDGRLIEARFQSVKLQRVRVVVAGQSRDVELGADTSFVPG